LSQKKQKKRIYSHSNKGLQLHYDRILDFHGYFPEKALLELEEVIFSTPSSSAILVIHGVGTGILKQSIRNFIRANKFVSSFEYGEETNLPGGAGVVLVYT
jgi:DNA mismatch repair protein MutS2